MDDPERFDIQKDFERFKYNIETFVIGQEVVGVQVEHDHVELFLAGDRSIRFSVDGPNIAITMTIPGDRLGPSQIM